MIRNMERVINIDSVGDYFTFAGQKNTHPLAGVIDLSLSPPVPYARKLFGCYTIFLKDVKCGDLRYGCSKYDYEEGSLVFVGPGQVAGAEGKGLMRLQGYALLFHPDLLAGTPLEARMKEYRFFSYDAAEALHLSEAERAIVERSLNSIRQELENGADEHSRFIITSMIQTFLEHCLRFYDRQFASRQVANQHILDRLDSLLERYFHSQLPESLGLPTVGYMAGQLHLSPNYFGDLVKRETGQSARDLIQKRLVAEAKARLANGQQRISEIAYALGFRYPHHLSRLFLKATGTSPREWSAYGSPSHPARNRQE